MTHRNLGYLSRIAVMGLALMLCLGVSAAFGQKQLSTAEQGWVSEARRNLAEALSDPALTEQQRLELIQKSARTMKEYGQAPTYPTGDTNLEILYRSNYETARRELQWTNDLYKAFSERLLDQQLKLINRMQIEVVEQQIKLTIPGRGVVELSGEVIGTIFGMNVVEGINNGQYADAKGLAAKFRAMAETKTLLRKLELAKEQQLQTAKKLERDLQNVTAMQERLRRQYQNTYNSTFTFRGYETGASEKGMNSAGTAAKPTPRANVCTCEDWDKDGRYGVVLGGKAIAPNFGTYSACKRHAEEIPACRKSGNNTASSPKTARTNICTCEDWDHDGRYGVVLNGKAIASNIGAYSVCMRHAEGLGACMKEGGAGTGSKTAQSNICTCEDWDRDGRYGVVLNGKAIAPNVGTYSACKRQAESMSRCKADH